MGAGSSKANNLSVLMIVKNAKDTIKQSLSSVKGLSSDIVIVDNYSTDNTVLIIKTFRHSRIFYHRTYDLGKQRAYGLQKTKYSWVLVIDSDEVISAALKNEIKNIISLSSKEKYNGYYIPFQNHFLGKPLHFGGENYKMLRLFKKNSVEIAPSLIHEKFLLKNGKRVGELKGKIYHYSYQSLSGMFLKFTDYAVREAKQRYEKGESITLRKLFFHPPHIFWARFVEDKGYKDGLFRIPLDVGFWYMEGLMYILLFIYTVKNILIKSKITSNVTQHTSTY